MRTLLHTCCGPCASACVPRLKELGREVTMLFANSNIDTREEFEKRLGEAKKLAAVEGVEIHALPYDHEEWLREVAIGYEDAPEKGARCERCFRYNLAKAAEFAVEHGFREFTTSLTVSPHKVSPVIFSVAKALAGRVEFLPEDFKKREGFKLSVRRTQELGLYRQAYCGCEFSKWRLHHRAETVSTNLDARAGRPGEVFTADYQTAGRGRLDHKWLSPPNKNLLMSVVLSVADQTPDEVATLPLVAGLAVSRALSGILRGLSPAIKWPNDILVGGKKIAGILCERVDDRVIVGIGVNVEKGDWPPEIAKTATCIEVCGACPQKAVVKWAILNELGRLVETWQKDGFATIYPEFAAMDLLKGKLVAVRQTDGDLSPVRGRSNGIQMDGSLDVGGTKIYAGEAHVEEIE